MLPDATPRERCTRSRPHCSRIAVATVASLSIWPRWATLPECVSNPASWPCSPTRWRSRSRPPEPGGPAHRTIIWVVVDGDDAFVRSVNGAEARWYREAVANPDVTVHVAGRRCRPGRSAAADPDSIRRTSDALVPQVHGRRRHAARCSPPTSSTRPSDWRRADRHVLRRVQAPTPRHRPGRDRGLADVARPGRRPGGRDAGALPRVQAAQARAPAPDRPAAADPDALHQHDQPGAGAVVPGRRGDGAPDPPAHPLERGGDGPARQQQLRGDRRPPRHVRLGRDPLRGRLQPLLPRQGRPDRDQRRPDLLPGPRRPGHLRPRLPRGPPDASTSSTTSGARRPRAKACPRTRTRG